MSKLTIKTNNHWRDWLSGIDLPESEKANFDYLDDFESGMFLKYKAQYYSMENFMYCSLGSIFGEKGWHAYAGDSYFSGVLIAISDDGQMYKIGTYYS